MEPVNGIGGYGQGCIKTKGDIGHGHVVINGFRQSDDVHAQLGEAIGVFLGAAPTYAYQGLQVMAAVIVDHHLGHVLYLVAHRHLMRLVAAGA